MPDLIGTGADMKAANQVGNRPLDYKSYFGHPESEKGLLATDDPRNVK